MSTLGRARGAAIVGLLVLAGLSWLYAESHDIARTWRDLEQGEPLRWPRRTTGPDAFVPWSLVVLVCLAALAAAAAVGTTRLHHRHRRVKRTVTYELRLGRDDLAEPYRVQAAFEGMAGAIAARWHELIWRGQDHFALEVHHLPSDQVAFTLTAPDHVQRALQGPLEDLYPDIGFRQVEGRPSWARHIVRLKKRRTFVLSLQTVRVFDHSFTESLAAAMEAHDEAVSVQLVLAPTPPTTYARARRLLKRRERTLQAADHRDPGELGIDSIVEAKELKGALETQHRSLLRFDFRVYGESAQVVRAVAGHASQLRSENELRPREMRLRRALYARRIAAAMPNPLPSRRTGLISTSELATIWQLPRARAKNVQIPRSSVRRAMAPPELERDISRQLVRDERGPVSLAAADRKFGHALIGGQGGGKSSVMARHFANDARDRKRSVILIDPKGPLAELCLGMAPADRKVHYLDLGRPEFGINPLSIHASPGARASLLLQALIEANPPGAIQAASDSFLRQALYAVCSVEPAPTVWHVHRMLDVHESGYRQNIVSKLTEADGADFACRYWRTEFPALIADRRFAAQALNPPRNKLERLISTTEIDTLLRHPMHVDIEDVLAGDEILIVAGAKSTVGEDNAIVVTQLILQLLQRALQDRQHLASADCHPVSLLVDEAHNVLTPSVARMLAEGRAAGLEAVFAWQYSAQIRDEVIRSGVRSLLQSISIFRMRELEDARSLAGLAMEVYSDRIGIDQREQERLRFSPDDITRLPAHQAVHLWLAGGAPRPGFVAHTLPMETLHSADLASGHRDAQKARGGHSPSALPDPLPASSEGKPKSQPQPRRKTKPRPPDDRSRPHLFEEL